MSFLAKLPSLERSMLIYGVGGYTAWSFLYSVTRSAPAPEKKVEEVKAAAAPVAETVKAAAAPAAASSPLKLEGPNDPAVLFALQDIQSRLQVIEKALQVE
mmetsp:Transcript_12458/g.24176  ORF Transcript_12458/g.24176 Transcript_12458/m.24176 type:complete len:101 (+) Transcript_12458:139-441(+)|eukprot:CAMPEP_0171500372 /NCGR_PEP_ID=MMETSP0958-20121227/8951_1 /TAXON_ID=87120 /ORGANISM="Aurantiochytrium limacinum, Strain ATCCMYA-1381" /LENGTH=100 /DNA_ID=CAMNT_0012035039 /DNA_START=60 /DNA_END=362 /DNA_ORIENTATION=+